MKDGKEKLITLLLRCRHNHEADIEFPYSDSGDVQDCFLFDGMQRISGHKEVNTSIPSTGEVFRRLIRKLPNIGLLSKTVGV